MSLKIRWQEFKKTAWEKRPVQERRILAAGAAVLAPAVFYFLLWQPAHEATARLEKTLPLMRMQAAQMKREAADVDALRQRAQPAMLSPAAMKTAIENSATNFQLRSAIESLESVEPNGVRVTFSSVPYAKCLDWMRSLQQDQHIRVDALSVVALQSEGMVKISATLVNGVSK
jgi:general secretion pathway protein M